MSDSGWAAGPPRHSAKMVLLLMVTFLVVPATVRAQIDPLIHSGVTGSSRARVTLGHTFDAAYVSADGQVWLTREQSVQVAVESPVARNLTTTLSLMGSHRSDRVEGEVLRDTWSLDQLSLGVASSLERPPFAKQVLLGLEALLPVQPSPAPPTYLADLTTVWLMDPVAVEIGGTVTAGHRLPPSTDLYAGVTFLASRHLSLAGRFDLHDLLGSLSAASFSFTVYRHPAGSRGLLWGWGFTHSVEAGRTIPGIHLVLGLER